MAQFSTNNHLIYVVDDDTAIARLLSVNLAARGYQVKEFRWHSRPVAFDGNLDPIVQLTNPNVDMSGTTRFVDRLLRIRLDVQ